MTQPITAGELVIANVPDGEADTGQSATIAVVAPTQVRKPWKSTVRTVFQAFVALAVLFPILVSTAGLDPSSVPWIVVPLAIAGAIARIMALPQVEIFLRRFLPFLSAAGKQYPA